MPLDYGHRDWFDKAPPEMIPGGLGADIGAMWAGRRLYNYASPMVRGKQRVYHGVAPWNLEEVKTQGLKDTGRPLLVNKGGMGIKGWVANLAAATKSREEAGKALRWGKGPIRDTVKSLFHGPTQVELPANDAGRIIRNIRGTEQVATLGKLGLPKRLSQILSWIYLRGSRGLEGGAAPSEIVGGQGYKMWSRAGMKSRPFRTALGVGLAGAGIAGGLGGASDIANKLNPFSKKGGVENLTGGMKPLSSILTAMVPAAVTNAIGSNLGRNGSGQSADDTATSAVLQLRGLMAGHEPVETRSNNPASAFTVRKSTMAQRLIMGLTLLKNPPLLEKFIASARNTHPGIIAHEVGHAEQPSFLTGTPYNLGRALPVPLAAAAAFKHGPQSKYLAAASALTSIPMIASEFDASRRGSKMMKELGRHDGSKAYAGFPTYLTAGLGPAAMALATRKMRI